MRKPNLSFQQEVTTHFQFLVDQHGFNGPDYSEQLLPAVRYERTGLQISIFLHADSHDGAGIGISVSISLDNEDGTATADLGELVEAAAFAPRHRVARKAHAADAMRSTLDDNATWIRRLMPVLSAHTALDTVRSAGRYETDRAGNPKRRPRGIKWKYG